MYRQSAVIPYRRGPSGLEVLLVTSRKGTRWVLPKGVVEPDLSPAASAAKEALEEAGVRGAIDDEPLGTYQYWKWGGTCTVQVFAMEVEEEVAHWPEASTRRRLLADRRRRQAKDQRGGPEADLRSLHRWPVTSSRRLEPAHALPRQLHLGRIARRRVTGVRWRRGGSPLGA
jgi:8-oxo-dGTP pyrophosphatase MutT (NUDIX family)